MTSFINFPKADSRLQQVYRVYLSFDSWRAARSTVTSTAVNCFHNLSLFRLSQNHNMSQNQRRYQKLSRKQQKIQRSQKQSEHQNLWQNQ